VKTIASYLYNCPIHGEISLDIKLGTAKEIEKCPQCESECHRVFSATNSIWKCNGAFGKSNQ
jgi:predicted nucleic acid-binding Zn ribbon protein